MPKVSICIPAYNHPELLRRTLDSVLVQDYRDFEVIITDDSDDDAIGVMVASLNDGRIFYSRNAKQLGSPANWNQAVGLAKGEYIKILHHDDWFANAHSLSQFVSLLDAHPASVLGFSASYACTANGAVDHVHAPTSRQLAELRHSPVGLAFNNYIGAPSATILRSKAGLRFDEHLKWLVDVDFYISVLSLPGKTYSYINEPQVCVSFQGDHQITNDCSGKQEIEIYEHVRLFNKIGKMPNQLPFIRSLVFYSFLFGRFSVRTIDQYFNVAQVQEISWLHHVALVLGSVIRSLRRIKRAVKSKFSGN